VIGKIPAEAKKITSGRTLIIDWANQQDHWLRAMVAEILESQTPLTEEQIEHFYNRLLVEKGLESGEPTNAAPLEDKDAAADSEQALTLAQIKDVENVNCLAAGQELTFNPRLTVIFGENAAGKSGYARILKGLTAVRTIESILSDISKPQARASASVSYWLGGDTKEISKATTIKWNGEQGLAPLTRIDVFDSRGVGVHVDGELNYVYSPSDLSLFPLITEAIDKIKTKLEKGRAEMLGPGNQFAHGFNRQGALYSKIDTLGASTDVEELKKLALVSTEEEVSLAEQDAKVNALRSDTTDASLQVALAEKQWLLAVQKCAEALSKVNVESYNASVLALMQAKKSYKATSEIAFADKNIPGFATPAWTSFIEAGESYIKSNFSTYPGEADSCVYCRQTLSPAAMDLLKKYREYCSNEAKKNVTSADSVVKSIIAPLSDAQLERVLEDAQKRGADSANGREWNQSIANAASKAINAKTLITGESALPLDVLTEWSTLLGEVNTKMGNVEKTIGELQTHGAERKKAFDEELKKLLLLKDRLQLRTVLPAILGYVDKCRWADRANNVGSKFRSLGTALTGMSKTASEQLLNQDFEKLFQDECESLKAPAVTLDFTGRKGQAARKKSIVSGHKLSDVLSEGEQKVIALADFIAETSLRRKSSPIVFDDPVNSLDYKRLKHVVRRIHELSKTRQIIVFTHNIWFATELLDCFTRDKKGCTYYDIRSEEGRRGLLSQANNPRMDVFDNYKKQLDELIKQASSQSNPVIKEALVRSSYDVLRGACETFVETDLFQDVTRRYRANIMMTKLSEIRPERLPAAIKTVDEIFGKCCDVMWGHSHTAETANIRPSLDELKAEWEQLKAARDVYLAKEKTA